MKEMEYGLKGKRTILDSGKYKGFRYWIINLGTHPTAYVEIPIEHKAFGIGRHEFPTQDIICHGGITYSRSRLCLDEEIIENSWIIGWDYAQHRDYTGFTAYMGGKKWTTAEILDEVHYVIEQLENMDRTGGEE